MQQAAPFGQRLEPIGAAADHDRNEKRDNLPPCDLTKEPQEVRQSDAEGAADQCRQDLREERLSASRLPSEEAHPCECNDKHASELCRPPHEQIILHARHSEEPRQREEKMNSAISDARAGEETAADERGSDHEIYLLRLRQPCQCEAEVAPTHYTEEPSCHREEKYCERRDLH